MVYTHLTVFGLGLIGGSFLMTARARYPELTIHAVDPNPEALRFAQRAKLVDSVSLDTPSEFAEQHLMVLGSHLKVNEGLLEQLTPKVKERNITVMDLGSCKRGVVELGQRLLPDQFIGGHPMAGRELSGIQQASELLFTGKLFLLTPTEAQQSTKRYQELEAFIEGLGCRPVAITPDLHDRYMAYMSHLPQLYAVALTNLLAKREPGRMLAYHGGGIEGQLRLSASPHAMWGPVFEENADNIEVVLDELIGILQSLKTDLRGGLGSWFQTSNQMHQAFHQLKVPMVPERSVEQPRS